MVKFKMSIIPQTQGRLEFAAIAMFACVCVLFSSVVWGQDSQPETQVDRTLSKFWALIDDRPEGEIRGTVVSDPDGKGVEEGRFRLALSDNNRFRFEYEGSFRIVIIGKDLRCDYKTVRGYILKDLETKRTLQSVSGITRQSSTAIAGLYVPIVEIQDLKQSLLSSTFSEYRSIDDRLCAIFDLAMPVTRMRYAISVDTGELVLVERTSSRTQSEHVVQYRLKSSFPMHLSANEFTFPDELE